MMPIRLGLDSRGVEQKLALRRAIDCAIGEPIGRIVARRAQALAAG
jgi:hypothetical protein